MTAPAKTRTPAPPQQPNASAASHEQKKKAYAHFAEQLEARTDAIRTRLEGSGISVDFFKQCALTALRETKDLLKATPSSIWSAIYKAADDRCLPDGKDGKIVIRQNYKDKTLEASWQLMVGGIRKKVRRSGEVLTFTAEVVYKKDAFRFSKGDNPYIDHEPTLDVDRGPIIAAYAIAKLANGETVRDVMPLHECHAIRDKFSDGWKAFKKGLIKDTPWNSSEGEMCKKTVARRLAKNLPMDTDVRAAIERDEDDVLPEDAEAATRVTQQPARPRIEMFTDEPMETGVDDEAESHDGGTTLELTAETVDEDKSATQQRVETQQPGNAEPAAPSAAVARNKPENPEELPHNIRVANLKARLSQPQLSRDDQLNIVETEILPNADAFSDEEINAFDALVKEA